MRIGMAQRALGQQLAVRDQFLDHRAIGVAVLAFGRQDALAGEERHVGRKAAIRQHDIEGIGIVAGIIADTSPSISSKSSSPWPGAVWTKPVPVSAVT